MEPAAVTFLSDYGLADEFVGVCHGVILRRCPAARIVDITHEIPPQDVRTGALVLRDAISYMPSGVHLAVVDPTVGDEGPRGRRALALRTASGELLVGPDNGLLSPAAERLGGAVAAVDLGRSPERLQPTSSTFHGRDIFAPVAGALAAGAPLESLGRPVAVETLARLALSVPAVAEGALTAHVLRIDRFGNLMLDARAEDLERVGIVARGEFSVAAGARSQRGRRAVTFAHVPEGELLLYEDSARMAALAVNRGSAAERLGARPETALVLRPA